MSTKAKFLTSFRINRDSYFTVTKLMPIMDRDQSYIINKAVQLGLMVMGEDPQGMIGDAQIKAVLDTQGAIIRDMTLKAEAL